MLFSIIFIPLLHSLFLVLIYSTSLNPILLQTVIKVYLSYWLVAFNLLLAILLLQHRYCVEFFMMEVFNLRLNSLSWFMCCLITLISSCVMLCSIDYLSIMDSYLFLIYMSLFQSCMLIFVLSNDLLITFIGWDYLGLISYLLINFWSSKLNSGIKAVVYNKIGDRIINPKNHKYNNTDINTAIIPKR